MYHVEHAASGAGKGETRESHGVSMPLLRSDTGGNTHVSLARMSHWEIEKQLFDDITIDATSLVAMLSVCLFFFLALVKFLRYNFVQKLNVIRSSPEWGLKAFCIWFLRLVCLWLLSPLLCVLSGSSQIRVSPAPTLPTQHH